MAIQIPVPSQTPYQIGLDRAATEKPETVKRDSLMKIRGLPLTLNSYEASEISTNKHFQEFKMPGFEAVYIPESMRPFTSLSPVGKSEFIVDDNRGAVSTSPMLQMDGTDYYLSVKGVGSTTSPFSQQLFGKSEICSLVGDSALSERIMKFESGSPRLIYGEVWVPGFPYVRQGVTRGSTFFRASEMADLTSIHGFRVAPLVKIVFLPSELDAEA